MKLTLPLHSSRRDGQKNTYGASNLESDEGVMCRALNLRVQVHFYLRQDQAQIRTK